LVTAAKRIELADYMTNGILDVGKRFSPIIIDLMLDDLLGSIQEWIKDKEKDLDLRVKARYLTREYTLAWYKDIEDLSDTEINIPISMVQGNVILPVFSGAMAAFSGEIKIY